MSFTFYYFFQVDLKHIHSSENLVEIGMNLKDYYPSGEWDILHVPAERHARIYECCPDEIYPDIFFNITLRRKTLFYTVNLIIPCVGISCLSVLTFYLPAGMAKMRNVETQFFKIFCVQLFFFRFGRESCTLYHHTPLADNVFSFNVWNHSFNFTRTAPVGQIFAIHNVSSRSVGSRYNCHFECSLS